MSTPEGERLSNAIGRERVYSAIDREIERAREKHGLNSAGSSMVPFITKFAILTEEYVELSREVVNSEFVPFSEKDAARRRVKDELTQVTAVAVQWLESFE